MTAYVPLFLYFVNFGFYYILFSLFHLLSLSLNGFHLKQPKNKIKYTSPHTHIYKPMCSRITKVEFDMTHNEIIPLLRVSHSLIIYQDKEYWFQVSLGAQASVQLGSHIEHAKGWNIERSLRRGVQRKSRGGGGRNSRGEANMKKYLFWFNS